MMYLLSVNKTLQTAYIFNTELFINTNHDGFMFLVSEA